MKTFLKTLLVASFLTIALSPVLPSPNALACSCIPPGTPQEHLDRAAAVFQGMAKNVSQDADYNYLVTFDVAKSWKGVSTPEVKISTARDSAACGYNFEEGKEYVVYAYDNEGELATGLCERTALASDASEDFAALGEGTVPTVAPAASESTAMKYGPVIAGVVIGLIFVVVVMKKKAI